MKRYNKLIAICTAVVISVTSVSFTMPAIATQDYISLAVGDVYQLPDNCDSLSLDTSVANISSKNVVTGRNPGATTIAYANDKGLHKLGIVVAKDKAGFYGKDVKGCTLDLSTVNYSLRVFGTDKVTFATTTPNIVTVTEEGSISTVAEGIGTITASMGTKSISIPITVVRKKIQYSLQEYYEIPLTASEVSVVPNVLDTSAKITYLAGDTGIATVSSNGKVTPVAPGLTTITVSAEDTSSAAGFKDIIYIRCVKATHDYKIADITLTEGDSYIVDIPNVKLKSSDDSIKIQGTKIVALKSGVAKVTASIPATDTYAAQTVKFSVTVVPEQEFDLEFVTAKIIGKAKYHEKAEVYFEIESNAKGELPVQLLCDGEDVYSGSIKLKEGKNKAAITTSELQSTGTSKFKLVVGNASEEFTTVVSPPDFQVTINDTPKFIKAGEFVQIGYTVKAIGNKKELHGPLQLMLDGVVLATEQIDITDTVSTKKSTIGVYIPQTLADGQHRLRLCVVLNGSTSALYDETIINTSNPNMGLSVNGQIVSVVDTYVYSSSRVNMTLQLATLNSHERVETISLNGKTYSVKQNNTSLDLALAKAEEQDITIVVHSADGTEEKSYALTVIRANDDTTIVGEFEDTQGNVYVMNTDATPYRLCLPADVYKGALTVKVEDSAAKIVSLNGKPVNKSTGVCSLTLPESGEINLIAEVQAGDAAVRIPYNILITNLNYTPEVQIVNSAEITNRIFGSVGVLVGDKLIKYGTESTSVEAAISTGHTKGLVVDLAVSDYNYSQYLGGYITIGDANFPIHWNSFDGPLREQAANIKHGYIYVDNASFDHDSNVASYTISVIDYADEFIEDGISKTTASVTFGVNVLADNFSAFFDDTTGEIVIETAARDFMLTMRKSNDNGITWTESFGCGLKTKVIDPGLITYEITLTDAMENSTVKTLVATLPGSEDVVENANVFVSTSRHADYVYINTLKSNSNTIDIRIADIFSD